MCQIYVYVVAGIKRAEPTKVDAEDILHVVAIVVEQLPQPAGKIWVELV